MQFSVYTCPDICTCSSFVIVEEEVFSKDINCHCSVYCSFRDVMLFVLKLIMTYTDCEN